MSSNHYYLFVDESEDHNLAKVDQTYPIFSLGGLCISEQEYKKLNAAVNEFKIQFFLAENIILHSSEMKRPKDSRSDPRYMFLLEPERRQDFYYTLDNEIIKKFNFAIVACFIHKQLHVDYYTQPSDPYYFSFENIMNRTLWHIGEGTVEIIAEKRGSELDGALYAEYERIKTTGVRFHSSDSVKSKTSLTCKAKSDNINGLQLIDLALSSLSRHYLGKTEKMKGNDISPTVLEQKFMFQSPTFFPKRRI